MTITTLGSQVANVPFSVTGTYTLSPATWSEVLQFSDDSGAPVGVVSPVIPTTTSSFSFVHPGLPAGTHSITIKDPLTGQTVTSNTFTVGAAQIISPVTPTGLVAGTAFTFTGTLSGYGSAPALNYQIDGGTPVTMTGVTSTTWSMSITAPATGVHTIVVNAATTSSSVITFSSGAVPKVITPASPSGVVVGTPFTFTGTLSGYTSIPALTYKLDSNAPAALSGVALGSWSSTIAAVSTGGSHTLLVSDGTNSNSTTFTASAGAHAIVAYAPSGTVTGVAFNIVGVLENYGSAPSLTYKFDAGGTTAITGVTSTGYSMSVTAPAAGSHTLTISDGTISSVVSFTVAAAATTAITWNPSAKTSTITLTGSNLIATAGGSTTIDAAQQSVLATAPVPPLLTTMPVAFEFTMTTVSENWACGIASTTWPLTSGNWAQLGVTDDGVGFYPTTGTYEFPPQAVVLNNTVVSNGTVADATGAVISVVVRGTSVWFSSPAMRTAGYTWNNSSTASPITNTGGVDLATVGAVQPYYPVYNQMQGGGAATFNDGSSAFSTWLASYITSNPSVVTLRSTNTPNSLNQIAAATPGTVTVNNTFNFTGVLFGYSVAPVLTYSLDGALAQPISSVTTTTFTVPLAIPASGTHTLVVTDGYTSSTVTFNAVSSAPPVFYVSGGLIKTPAGATFVAKGINIGDDGMPYACASAGCLPLLTYFPGCNHIRCNTGPYNGLNGTAGALYYPPSYYLAGVQNATGYTRNSSTGAWTSTSSTHVVVEFEDHDANMLQGPFTGAALNVQTTWYAEMAAYYNGNPYVWFGTQNEMNSADGTYSPSACYAMTASHQAIYAAIRGAGNNTIIQIMAGLGGSTPSTVGHGNGWNEAAYLSMTGIVWEIHCYYSVGDTTTAYTTAAGYVNGGTSGPTERGGPAGWGIAGAQSIQSADGVVPVIIGEWGSDSGNTSTTEAAALVSAVAAVQASGVGSDAWWWYGGYNGMPWSLVNDGGPFTAYPAITLTTWGSEVAAII
jgi:hypothetical protein